ncbi:MAG: hypothetical protein BGO43_14280 [Gammaproteobacteria bacterium 39-13]|nr:fused MFS/spermidine synthase [Gammaproteobacteria bacterium]OJV95070.1 MAG: hypothetical protein BGO43_14280 [Gammaproteobacteria bacterium 39-13]
MSAFSLSIFLSAFLLFIIQPLLAKKLLPWFGGSPAVWLSIVLFFQSALLIGYLYAYFLTKITRLNAQVFIHLSLLLLSILFIPLNPLEEIATLSLWHPIAIIAVLSTTLLLPGIIISASSPLFQYWYCQCYQTDFPYRYYALSNFGSLLGLLAFPFVLEPLLGLNIQLSIWSGLYLLYIVSSTFCLMVVARQAKLQHKETVIVQEKLAPLKVAFWIALTLLSCALLLTTTQVMLQNVASFPLLWVIPLALYLITFIITFSYPKVYYRPLWLGVYTLLCASVFYFSSHHKLMLSAQIGIYASLLFAGCMICHGELIRSKPSKQHLTTFYLAIAFGGVIGGLFINIIAPLFFNEWWDFYLVLLAIFSIGAVLSCQSARPHSINHFVRISSCMMGFMGLSVLLYSHLRHIHEDIIYHHRNFFGAFEVADRNKDLGEYHYRALYNGNILHGQQFLTVHKQTMATSYYSVGSGIGHALTYQRLLKNQAPFNQGLRVGVIGLGSGTIATLTENGDFLRFYEIDPDIHKIARKYFSYLDNAKAAIDVTIGDGRLKLTQALKIGSENYDVLAIDAFNGDAIPVHLLTLEAMQIYLSHLAPNGILAFHVSSRYIDLYPPLQALASKLNLYAFITYNDEDRSNAIYTSEWVLITRRPELGAYLYQEKALSFHAERMENIWTDDFNYLLSVIRW